MAENKDIDKQVSDGVKQIKSETKTGMGFVKQAVGAATADIKQALKQAENTLRDDVKQAKADLSDAEKKAKGDLRTLINKSKQQIRDTQQDAIEKVADAVDKVTQNAVGDVEEAFKQSTKEAEKAIEDSKKEAVDAVKEAAKESSKQEKKKPVTEQEKKQPTDLATKLLTDILSEVKVLRKVVEKRVSFDPKSGRYRGAGGRYVKESDVREEKATREKDKKEEEKKGLFSNLKKRFVAVKEATAKKFAPAMEGAKQVKEGMGGLLTNPVVLAGLLAFLAPKELLSFLKGFLGEMLFGENANAFTQGFVGFVGLWAGFKLYNAVANIIKVIKGLWTIGRFLFMNPALLLALTSIVAVAQLISDFKKKYAQREERKTLEQELKGLEGKQYENTEQGKQQQAADQKRAGEIKARLQEMDKAGTYSTVGQARKASLTKAQETIDPNSGKVKEAVDFIAKYDTAVEKQKAGQPLTKEEQSFVNDFKSKDDLFSLFPEFNTPEKRAQIQQLVDKKKQPTAETKPTATPTQAAPVTTPIDDSRELNRAATQATSTSQTAGYVSGEPPTAQGQEQKPAIEPPAPSIGQTINEVSASVEAGYEEQPQDTATMVTQDQTQVPKKANVIDTIPGIFANRSSLSVYEVFRVHNTFAMT